MELTYTKCGDYLIPNLVLSDTKEYHIGKYGRLRRAYLKEHRPILYTDLIVTEKLFPHLEEIDTACRERLEIIEKSHDAARGRHRSPKSCRPDGMGALHELHPQQSRGNRPGGAGLLLREGTL